MVPEKMLPPVLNPDVEKQIREVLDKAFPNNYEIVRSEKQYTDLANLSFNSRPSYEQVLCHIDTVIISNDHRDSRILKNLFIGMSITPTGHIRGLVFMTPTKTHQRMAETPCLSHGGSLGTFGGSCYGGGPLSELLSNCYSHFSKQQFIATINAIKAYVEWENNSDRRFLDSEGDINRNEVPIVAPLNKETITKIISENKKTILKTVQKGMIKNKVVLKTSDGFEKCIATALLDLYGEDSNYLCFKAPNGFYFGRDSEISIIEKKGRHNSRGTQIVDNRYLFTFLGKDIRLNNINLTQDEKHNRNYFPHPEITKQILRILNQRVFQFQRIAPRKSYKGKNSDGNNPKVATSNKSIV